MREIKRLFLRFFFGMEVVFFIGFYVCGPHGVKTLKALSNENNQLQLEITHARQEVIELEQKIVQWNTYPFYKEKIAREQLQMACKGEEIYYLM